MLGNPEGSELNPAVDDRRCCKKSPFVLFCIGKRTREGCDRGSEVGTIHYRWGEGPVLLRKPRKSGKKRIVRKNFSPGGVTDQRLPASSIMVVQSPPLLREVDRNGETNSPKGVTIWSLPNRLRFEKKKKHLLCCVLPMAFLQGPALALSSLPFVVAQSDRIHAPLSCHTT